MGAADLQLQDCHSFHQLDCCQPISPICSTDEERRHALARQENEPVMEIFQHKGNSECINGLSSIFGAPDEHCEFEQVRRFGESSQVVNLRIENSQLKTSMSEVLTDECGDDTGRGGMVGGGCVAETDFMRSNLLKGLRDESRLGVNSAKLTSSAVILILGCLRLRSLN